MTSFNTLGLSPHLLAALTAHGHHTPTPIQAQAIPHALQGRDVLGMAQTGTGKTGAFALPILHRLAAARRRPERHGCRVLVLAPTRELAAQIVQSFVAYGKGQPVTTALVIGGASQHAQVRALSRGVDVLVATPGRLLDHLEQRTVRLDQVETVVLDEVDRMLDLGFIHPIRRVMRHLPAERQALFFSATLPREIRALAAELLRDPVEVSVAPAATPVEQVTQSVILVDGGAKQALLQELLVDPALTRTLVFTRTKHRADQVTRRLAAAGIAATAIHGNKSQSQRERALAQFRAGRTRVLVATDIAARGLHIDEVSHVVNFDLPFVAEDYVHRIGRTARAGAVGTAISFCDADEQTCLRGIETLTRQHLARTDRSSGWAAARQAATAAPRQRHRRGGRPAARRAA